MIDWHHPEFAVDSIHPQSDDEAFREQEKGRDQQKYADYLHGQTRELLTNYGKIDIIWYDFTGPEKSRADWRSEELVAMARELQPDIIINDRIDYPESADFVTPGAVPAQGVADPQRPEGRVGSLPDAQRLVGLRPR